MLPQNILPKVEEQSKRPSEASERTSWDRRGAVRFFLGTSLDLGIDEATPNLDYSHAGGLDVTGTYGWLGVLKMEGMMTDPHYV